MSTEFTFFAAVVAAVIAGLVTNLVVPVVIRIAEAMRAVDGPNERKHHAQDVPRLGGLAIACGLALAAIGVAMMHWEHGWIQVGRSELVALAVGTLMVFLVGVVDDLVGASAAKKFLVQIAAAYLVVNAGWSFTAVSLPGSGEPLALGMLGNAASVLWIVGVTNAINLLDGLDGLASGVVAIIGTGLLIYAVMNGNVLVTITMAAMAGSCLGFLGYNWAPARIFLGDSGSLTLGFLLGAMSVQSSLKAPAAVAILVPVLALGLPVIDTLLVMAVRFLDRPHGPLGERVLRMFRPDRKHLHHNLEQLLDNRRRIVGAIYAAALTFCALALLVAVTHNAVLGVVLVVLEFAAMLLMRSAGPMRKRWLRGKARTVLDEKGP